MLLELGSNTAWGHHMLLVYNAEGCTKGWKQSNFEGHYAARHDAFTLGFCVL
jgi:hypothetical protein